MVWVHQEAGRHGTDLCRAGIASRGYSARVGRPFSPLSGFCEGVAIHRIVTRRLQEQFVHARAVRQKLCTIFLVLRILAGILS